MYDKKYNLYNYVIGNGKHIYRYKDILKIASNGDIILLSGYSFCENVIKYITESIFSHVCMIIKEDNELYIWESDIGQRYKNGPRIIKISDKLNYYSGYKVGLLRILPDNIRKPTHKEILAIADNNIYKSMNFNVFKWIFSYLYDTNNSSLFCSELVAITLKHLHILTDKRLSHSYSPGSWYGNDDVCTHVGEYWFYF